MHQEMDVIRLTIKFYEIGLEGTAYVLEYPPHGVQNCRREDFPAVLSYEHEMHVQIENTMPSGADIACINHGAMLS